MNVQGTPWRTIWPIPADNSVGIIDQTRLPHEFVIRNLRTLDDAAWAISTMQVRGSDLIGVAAAYGIALGLNHNPSDTTLSEGGDKLLATRPTAVNLRWAVDCMRQRIQPLPLNERTAAAFAIAAEIAQEDVTMNEAIGRAGLALIRQLAINKGPNKTIHILTHCNSGWLSSVDWGTATSSIYRAHEEGIPLHIWVNETRPRNQGASLTAWELQHHGIPHTVIVDTAGGHLMQHGKVDLVLVGSDRTTSTGDVCNKIGTYLMALSAFDNKIPFYVAFASSSIDWQARDGLVDIPIEERDTNEVTHIAGCARGGEIVRVQITPVGSPATNPGFDVTPARLVSGLITERGICDPTEKGLKGLFPDLAKTRTES